MFVSPIIPAVRMDSMADVTRYSIYYKYEHEHEKMVYCTNNGMLAYITESGEVRATPFYEAGDILEANGYRTGSLFVPYSNGEQPTPELTMLRLYHKQFGQAVTFEEARKISREKGIDDSKVEFTPSEIKVCEVSYGSSYVYKTGFEDIHSIVVTSVTSMYLLDGKDCIGTFVHFGNNFLVICDQWGRTFVVTPKTGVLNGFVNKLIDAGYTLMPNPEDSIKLYSYGEEVPGNYGNKYLLI